MPQFLSDDWLDALGGALDAATTAGDAVVAWSVDKGPAWTIRVAGGRASLEPGVADDATVTMSMSAATAASIVTAETSAQAAFMRGDLKVGGDVRSLVDASPVIDQLAGVFDGVRAETTFD